VTEIPEHLLRRSKAAKGAKSGDAAAGDAGGGDAGAGTSVTPAAAPAAPAARPAAAVPAQAPPEPPKPLPAYIEAHRRRRRIPVWALPVVVALPIWALGYAGTMQQPEVEDPLFTDAAAVFSGQGCSGCHGASGGGGVGYQLSAGEVLATFPDPIDQMVFVARGTEGTGPGTTYGDPQRAGGAHVAGERGIMPTFAGQLSLEQLQLVVLHEREVLSGEEATDPAYVEWQDKLREAVESGEETPIDDDTIALLLACANPEYTPGATGQGGEDCPGPAAQK
jgi:mono/diheme cytochrome c family protein